VKCTRCDGHGTDPVFDHLVEGLLGPELDMDACWACKGVGAMPVLAILGYEFEMRRPRPLKSLDARWTESVLRDALAAFWAGWRNRPRWP
jgi:hypothetical protein